MRLATSEGFSASASAATRDARATAEAAETNDVKRIVELNAEKSEWKESQAIVHLLWTERAYVSVTIQVAGPFRAVGQDLSEFVTYCFEAPT